VSSTTNRVRSTLPFGRRQRPEPPSGEITGTARLGRRTKDLVKHLRPGEIAFIDHTNIDRVAAEDLVGCGVRAVVNASQSSDGRYPNAGPLIITQAGIRLIDAPEADPFKLLRDGDTVTFSGGTIRTPDGRSLQGRVLEPSDLERQLAQQREEIDKALAAFAENTVDHMRREGDLLTDGLAVPELRTPFRDRHTLIVVRGPTHRRDLRALRAYIRDVKPILVGVDGGADAILEAGLRPHMILGDMDSATDSALGSGAELVVHGYADGRAPGAERLTSLGLEYRVIPAPGTSQDVAMLIAHERGAALIVSVGAHFNLIEFLDKNREGMASTFLTRLRIGELLVDAKGVSRLYRPAMSFGALSLFLLAFTVLLVIVVLTSSALDDLVELLWLKLRVMFNLV